MYAAHGWWDYLLASSPRVFALGGQQARAARQPTTEAARESLATWSSPAHDHDRMVRRMQENGMRATNTPSFWGHLRCRPAPCRDADRLASKASQESRGHPDLQQHKKARALGVGVGCCVATRCVASRTFPDAPPLRAFRWSPGTIGVDHAQSKAVIVRIRIEEKPDSAWVHVA